MTLSAFIITRDGARTLPHVVANLRRCAQEIVIAVDTDSVDDTFAVAWGLGDVVTQVTTDGCPESVRNETAALCRGDWLLMADDDELFPPAWQAALPGWLAAGNGGEYLFPRRHIVAGGARWISSEPWWPDWQLRLRRKLAWQVNPWPRLPHSVPQAIAPVWVNAPFWHLKFITQDAERRLARMTRWAELWPQAANDHYRKFAQPEDFTYQTAPVDETAPAEFAALVAATTWEAA